MASRNVKLRYMLCNKYAFQTKLLTTNQQRQSHWLMAHNTMLSENHKRSCQQHDTQSSLKSYKFKAVASGRTNKWGGTINQRTSEATGKFWFVKIGDARWENCSPDWRGLECINKKKSEQLFYIFIYILWRCAFTKCYRKRGILAARFTICWVMSLLCGI